LSPKLIARITHRFSRLGAAAATANTHMYIYTRFCTHTDVHVRKYTRAYCVYHYFLCIHYNVYTNVIAVILPPSSSSAPIVCVVDHAPLYTLIYHHRLVHTRASIIMYTYNTRARICTLPGTGSSTRFNPSDMFTFHVYAYGRDFLIFFFFFR
jgi:hypothetical protein